jgi:hypothetical protein
VVVGYKDRWDSTAALDAGFDEAVRRDLSLVVVHAHWPRDVARAEAAELRHLDGLVAERRARVPGLSVDVRMAAGDFARAVGDLLTRRDLLVLGRSGAWTTHPTLGPVGSELLLEPRCPVLVAPPSLAVDPAHLPGPAHPSRGTPDDRR